MKNFKDSIGFHLTVIIVFSVCIRLLAGYADGWNFDQRNLEYHIIAKNMVEKGEYAMDFREYGEYKAVIAPGYTLVIYSAYKTFGIHPWIMIPFQIISMTAFSIIIYMIARLLFGCNMIAFIAGVLATLHPGILYYSVGYIHEFDLYLPLFYACVLLFCLILKNSCWKYFILLGLTGGVGVLTRGTLLPFLVLGLLFCLIYPFPSKNDFAGRLLKVATALAIAVIINIPWTVRNYMVFGKVIYSQTSKWEQFWVGNNPEATGSHFRTDGTTVLSHKPSEMQEEINASDSEIKDDQIFRKYSLKYVSGHPADFIKGIFRKGIYFWWFNPQTGLFYPKSYLVAYKIMYIGILGFSFAGLWICWRRKLFCMEMVFPFLLMFGIWGVHTLNFSEMRHRWTVEPVLLIFASVAIFFLADKFLSRKEIYK
ncbi:MAG TPA: hypothetical protein DET40_17355 [Lentisphaeria bacterium]|nr:MAG: hypothetical protein A2X45_02650 [Lentisphaerae bacterium GWF2_50_93]HCE45310.1 hypothetical protein [Lentisphaeria bacterium]